MDGTFYLGDNLLPGALEFVDWCQSHAVDYLFLTNNSSKHRGQYAKKLQRLGLKIGEDKIFTSGEATAIYLNQKQPGAKIYLVGTPAQEDEFKRLGGIPDSIIHFQSTL